MPSYAYLCECGWKALKFFRSLPSDESKLKACVCEECGRDAQRSLGDEGFFAVGGQNGGIEKAAAFAATQGPDGRPIYKDENGRVHEIRTSRDLDSFTRHNAVGPPEVEWKKNPDGGQDLAPVVRNGQVVRKAEKLVPLDGGYEWAPPSEAPTGRPIKNGVVVQGETTAVDPSTGKRITVWGNGREAGEPDVKEAGVRRPPDGKKWS